MPHYIGYVQTANNAPTLFFDTGFLVQASPKNPAAVGWYAYRHVYHYGANMSPDIAGGIASLNQWPMLWDGLNQQITAEMIRQQCSRAAGQPHVDNGAMYVMVDTPDVENVTQASFYSFAGALFMPGDAGFQANFDAAHANAVLGALNPAGLPTQHPVKPTAVGITRFAD